MSEVQHFRFDSVRFTSVVAHHGRGSIDAARVLDGSSNGASFVDLVVVPPRHTIGLHTHGNDEEIYIVVDGSATMEVDASTVQVGPGDVVVNRPGGTHGLTNTGVGPLRLVVVDIAVPDGTKKSSAAPNRNRLDRSHPA